MDFPSITTRVGTYIDSREKWVTAGQPLRSPERIAEIYNTFCKDCIHHRLYCCEICGCFINLSTNGIFPNKISWATTRCPLNEIGEISKWIEEKGFRPEDLNPSPIITDEPPKKQGCGCH